MIRKKLPIYLIFSEIGEKLSGEIPSTNVKYADYIKHNECTFDFVEITEDEVRTELKNLKDNKGFGPDNISPKFLKDSSYVISSTLTSIFNQSLKMEKFPDEWALARVSPIFKAGLNLATIDRYLFSQLCLKYSRK